MHLSAVVHTSFGAVTVCMVICYYQNMEANNEATEKTTLVIMIFLEEKGGFCLMLQQFWLEL